MAFRDLVVEAVKKSTLIANKVANNLNIAEWKNMSRMQEMDSNYISDLASFKDIRFDDLGDDEKQEVIEKIWNKVKSGEKPAEVLDENPDEKPLDQSELKQKIMDYVKEHGAILYPLESAAEELAGALAAKEESKEEKCSCCGKSPCECGPDCKCKCKKEGITSVKDLSKNQFISLINNKLEVAKYDGGYSNSERDAMVNGCIDLIKEYGLPEEDIKVLEDKFSMYLNPYTCPHCGKSVEDCTCFNCPKCGNNFDNCTCSDDEDDYEVYESTLSESAMSFRISSKKNSYGDTVYYVSQIKLDNGEVWNNYPKMLFGPDNTYEDKASAKRAIDRYMQDRGEYKIIGESMKEATMNDIPHEIDDQIHTLKDMRFELEQTKKNWNIAGVETQPMDEVLKKIDDLIASLYQNGAKMADDEISKGPSETQDTEKDEEE